jgi:hypothetical protein
MILRFYSDDKLAWMDVDDDGRKYFVTLIRTGQEANLTLRASDMISVINSTLQVEKGSCYRQQDLERDTERRRHLEITCSEANRLKECYIKMKVHHGHAI